MLVQRHTETKVVIGLDLYRCSSVRFVSKSIKPVNASLGRGTMPVITYFTDIVRYSICRPETRHVPFAEIRTMSWWMSSWVILVEIYYREYVHDAAHVAALTRTLTKESPALFATRASPPRSEGRTGRKPPLASRIVRVVLATFILVRKDTVRLHCPCSVSSLYPFVNRFISPKRWIPTAILPTCKE